MATTRDCRWRHFTSLTTSFACSILSAIMPNTSSFTNGRVHCKFYFWPGFTWIKVRSQLDPYYFVVMKWQTCAFIERRDARHSPNEIHRYAWDSRNVKRRAPLLNNRIKQQTKKFIRKTFAFNYNIGTESADESPSIPTRQKHIFLPSAISLARWWRCDGT